MHAHHRDQHFFRQREVLAAELRAHDAGIFGEVLPLRPDRRVDGRRAVDFVRQRAGARGHHVAAALRLDDHARELELRHVVVVRLHRRTASARACDGRRSSCRTAMPKIAIGRCSPSKIETTEWIGRMYECSPLPQRIIFGQRSDSTISGMRSREDRRAVSRPVTFLRMRTYASPAVDDVVERSRSASSESRAAPASACRPRRTRPSSAGL